LQISDEYDYINILKYLVYIMEEQILIIGNGISGVTAARNIHKL